MGGCRSCYCATCESSNAFMAFFRQKFLVGVQEPRGGGSRRFWQGLWSRFLYGIASLRVATCVYVVVSLLCALGTLFKHSIYNKVDICTSIWPVKNISGGFWQLILAFLCKRVYDLCEGVSGYISSAGRWRRGEASCDQLILLFTLHKDYSPFHTGQGLVRMLLTA